MTEKQAEEAIKKWQREWKQKQDKDQRNARNDSDGLVHDDANTFTGCTEMTLQHMVNVGMSCNDD